MTLEALLENFDGNAISQLTEAQFAWHEDAGYLDELIRLTGDPRPNVSNGASWILKAELEDGAVLGEVQIEKLLQSLDSLSSWTAILHICQSVDYLTLKFSQAKLMIRWAKSIETHERPFNRAWAIHVRVILAQQFDALDNETESALYAADSDRSASVRARARQLRKKFDL